MLLHKTVIIEREKEKQEGIIDPTKQSQVGVIKEIGADLKIDFMESGVLKLAEGNRVVYYENSLLKIEYDGKVEFVLDYDDIIKVI